MTSAAPLSSRVRPISMILRRSWLSASTPETMDSSTNGSAEATWIIATISGLACASVTTQAAATDCAQVPRLANRLQIQMMRKAPMEKGASTPLRGSWGLSDSGFRGRSCLGETDWSMATSLKSVSGDFL
ncbi:hypothetical protein D3C80_1697170 [compost metagenome]